MKKPTERQLLHQAARTAIQEAHQAGLATTHGDDKGVYRLHPDGRREYLNPPIEAVQKTVKEAIKNIHAAGLPSAHADDQGRVYERMPDGCTVRIKKLPAPGNQ